MSDEALALKVVRDTPTLRELTTEKLRQAILDLKFKQGEHLIERDLCERTGVSRSCVREALRHLEAEGLVERRGGKGLFVASVTLDEVRQIYEVRAALEAEMGRLFAARATDADLAALSEALDGLERARAANDIRAYVGSIDRFYEALIAGSGNEVARRILRTLHARITYLRTVTTAKADKARSRDTLTLMRGIATAARRRDGEGVAQRCRKFVERSAAFAIKVLGNQPDGDTNGG